jgi:hypothetical protein
MKTIALFIALFITQFAFSQGFVTENKTWHVKVADWYYINTEIFKTEGDTIINDMTYKKLWFSFNDSAMINKDLRGFLREESGIVYYRDYYSTEDKVLYNFNLETGDTAYIFNYYCGEQMVVITGMDMVDYYGTPRKRWALEGWSGEFWIEGIGSTNGLLYSMLYECTADIYKELICCHENDTLIYMKEYEDECYQTNVGIDEGIDGVNVIIKPNPVRQGQSFVVQCDKVIDEVEILNSAGILVEYLSLNAQQTFTISSGQLMPGLYLIRIKTAESQALSKKIIIR